MKRKTLWLEQLPRIVTLLVVGVLGMALSACQLTLLDPGSVTVAQEAATPGDSAMDGLTDVQRQLATRAVEAVATELDLAPDAVSFAAISEVDWPDASLGCPQEGMMYAQMITRGHMITLEVDGVEHEVHAGADADSQVIFCQHK